ncbi:MAG: glucose 1-dehydrogenase [Desulfatiglandales bacterium]|jgi:2-deoxy-D-gluconate 3-dehydrogenase
MISEKFSLKGRSGIVTGGGTGLGKGITTALVQAGAEVAIVGRRLEVLENTAKELSQQNGKVIPIQADVSNLSNIKKIVDHSLEVFGKIDFLFNNAGTIRRAPSEEHSEEDWDIVLQTNLKAPFFLTQAVARTMIARKIKGKIINTSSLISVIGGKNIPSYAASKGGISQITKSMANDWAKYGIRVNAIAPGYFITDVTQPLVQDKVRYADITARIPLGRWGKPEDLGGVAVFLASDASDYLTGQTIFVDGGWLSF